MADPRKVELYFRAYLTACLDWLPRWSVWLRLYGPVEVVVVFVGAMRRKRGCNGVLGVGEASLLGFACALTKTPAVSWRVLCCVGCGGQAIPLVRRNGGVVVCCFPGSRKRNHLR